MTTAPTLAPYVLVDAVQAAEILGVQLQTLAAWRCRRQGPPFIKLGRCVKYKLADLNAYIGQNTHTPPTHDPQ